MKQTNISLIEFAKITSHGYWKEIKHLKLLSDNLTDVVERKIKRLIINMPPRHGKSELCSKFFPAWYLINNPDHRIILTSYNADFAKMWGEEVKNILIEFGEKFKISISKNTRSKGFFKIEKYGGSMTCVGAGGSLTGRGADLIILDDIIKNNTEANSIKKRESIWEWFLSTCYTRLEPNGVLLIVMTRWNKDDICGRIEKKFKVSMIEV